MMSVILIIVVLIAGYSLKVKSDYNNIKKAKQEVTEFLSFKKYFILKNGIDLFTIQEYKKEIQTEEFYIISISGNYGKNREKYYILSETLKDKMLFAACSLKPAILFKNNNNEWVFYSDLGKCCYMIIPSDSEYGKLIIKNEKERGNNSLKEITQEEIEKFVGSSINYRISD